MADNAQATAVPGWVLKFMDAIDTLEFGEGFAPLTEDTDMFFGTAHIHGVEAIKAFFVKIDAPLIITHEVLEFWTAGDGMQVGPIDTWRGLPTGVAYSPLRDEPGRPQADELLTEVPAY